MYRIRHFHPADYDNLARVRNLVMPEPVDGPTMAEWDQTNLSIPTNILQRIVAVDQQDQIVGSGFAEHLKGMPEGRWAVHSLVHPSHRGRGIGRMLWQETERIALEGGATELESWVRGEDDDSFAWAQRRGYLLERQRTESLLDLSAWDGSQWTGLLERVQQGGITFRFFPRVPLEEPLSRSFYELERETASDVPSYDDEYPDYETWKQLYAADKTPIYIAAAMDGERVAGYSMLVYPRVAGASGYTGYTATLRAYRGRGIALAVKVLTVMEAVRAGIPRMRTNNDPDNPAMLAVNQKLGYQLIPGPRRMRKQVQA